MLKHLENSLNFHRDRLYNLSLDHTILSKKVDKAEDMYFEWKSLTETTGYESHMRFEEFLGSDRKKIEFVMKHNLLDKFKIPKALHSIAF